jgi:hypothetical protein
MYDRWLFSRHVPEYQHKVSRGHDGGNFIARRQGCYLFLVWMSRSDAERAKYNGEPCCAFVDGYIMNRTPPLTIFTVGFLALMQKT